MKPFDLKKAIAGAKLVTRNENYEVVGFHHFSEHTEKRRSVALLKHRTGGISSQSYLDNGMQSPNGDTGLDLFMATTKKTYYLVVFPSSDPVSLVTVGRMYEDKAEAERIIKQYPQALAIVPVEVEL